MSQNLCLICCYSFQEKRSRFISNEAKECFAKFSKELGFPLENQDNGANNSSLSLPFGECITVCGDCLSLVVVYVQHKSVQRENEDRLLELQKAVCKAIKELKSVVEDVQSHINRLHSTIRMGNDSSLEQFMNKSATCANNQEDAKNFREKVLSLSTCSVEKSGESIHIPGGTRESVFIKVESTDAVEESYDYESNDHNVDVNFDADFTCKAQENFHKKIMCKKKNLRPLVKQDYAEEVEFQAHADNFQSDTESQSENDFEPPVISKQDTPKRDRRRLKRDKTEVKKALKYGNIITAKQAVKWKYDLFKRVNKELCESAETDIRAETNEATNEQIACTRKNRNSFHVVDDQLQLRGIIVKVHERRRMLECMRCYKMYFQERDVSGVDVNLETLMRKHILDKHFVVKKKKPPEEMEVIEYTSHTKTKLTFKLACKNRYSYTRRCGKQDAGSSYFRCDFRKGNCSASILHKNGKYIRLRKGWNDDGFHTVHPPDVERTNRQIALGNAKHMYLTDDSKTIDEVCSIIMNQADEQSLPITKLKRAMVYSKYGSRGRAPEEKLSQTAQCCYCGKIYKEQRGLSRHMKTQHQESGSGLSLHHRPANEEEETAPSGNQHATLTLLGLRSATSEKIGASKAPKLLQKPLTKVVQPEWNESCKHGEYPEPSDGPSIVFTHPSAANSFVNRCISAIIQQVGVSMSPNAVSSTAAHRPSVLTMAGGIGNGTGCSVQSSESPAPSEPSQSESSLPQNLDQAPRLQLSPLSGTQSNHWSHSHSLSQSSSSSSGNQSHAPGQCTSSSSNSNPVWQWGLH